MFNARCPECNNDVEVINGRCSKCNFDISNYNSSSITETFKSKIEMKDKRDTIRVPRFQIGAPMFSSEKHFSSRNQKEKSYLSPEINIPRSRSILKKRRTLTLESNLSSKRRDTSNNKVRFGSEAVPVVQVFKVKSYRNEYKEMQQKYEQQRIENEKQKTVCSGVCIIF